MKATKRHAILHWGSGVSVERIRRDKRVTGLVGNAAEELEETAKLHFLLTGRAARWLDAAQVADLDAHFPS